MARPGAYQSNGAVFFGGICAAATSVFFPVISGTYVGIGALTHGFGLSEWWLALSTVLVWAGPAQIILVSALGTGATLFEVAIAVSLSGVRLLPMVMTLLPMLRRPDSRVRDLLLPAHFTSVSMWVESLRLLPALPVERRAAFCNGLSVGFMTAATCAGFAGYYLAAELPLLFAGALQFLTPISFLVSTACNARMLMDKIALLLGLVLGTALTVSHVQLDLFWAGVGGGTLAYFVHRLREAST